MTQARDPWLVRALPARHDSVLGDLSSEAAESFAALYAEARRRGRLGGAAALGGERSRTCCVRA